MKELLKYFNQDFEKRVCKTNCNKKCAFTLKNSGLFVGDDGNIRIFSQSPIFNPLQFSSKSS